jgi:hypothetical protein
VPRQRREYPPPVRFENPRLGALDPSVRASPVGLLHFGTRASNALEGARVGSIGELILAARRGFVAPHAGQKSVAEIEEALYSLSRSIGRDGRVDWLRYATNRHFLILPQKDSSKLSGRQFLQLFPVLLETAVESACGSRGKLFFRRSLLGHDSAKATGRHLGVTRQATSLIKEKVLRMLRGAIFNDDYRGCRFRFRHAFVIPLRELRGALSATHGRALAYTEWNRVLEETWGVTAIEVAPVEKLLFSIIDYQVMRPARAQIQAIVLPNGRSVLPLRSAIANTARLLKRKFPKGLSKQQLFRELRRSDGKTAPRLPEIPALVKAILGVEEFNPKGRIRARVENMWRITDQLERILRERGTPMRPRELAAEIGKFKGKAGSVRTSRNVGSALSGDKRFKPIGRSGVWALSEWNHIEARTVADIAADLIRQAARPMTEAELFDLISPRRSVSKGSIGSLLREDGRFRRTKPITWELK